jgi:benzoyl-CoA reductase/2-hydroxyglutaryl-CoA dehydratase subunit BcrC/BadD/HgdB
VVELNDKNMNRVIPYRMLLNTISTTKELVERILPESGAPSLRIGLQQLETVLKTYIEKAQEDLPIVGYHFSFPAEYLQCFNCVPVCVEGTSYTLAALLERGSEKYYDIMHNYGHPFHTCTSQKGTMGMTLDDLFLFDSLITPTSPCDCTIASYPFFRHVKNTPLVILDMPFLHEEKSYQYYAIQLKEGLIKLGKNIGQEPDFNKLKKAIELENQVNKLKLEIFELIKTIPSPISNFYNAISASLPIYIAGTPENLFFYKQMLEIVKERYRKKEHYGGEEKIRSIWPYMISFFSIDLMEWLDRELGLSVLFDIFNYNFYDPINTKSDLESMFYGMSRKSMGFPMVKQSTEFFGPFIEYCIDVAKDFSADCFIYTQSIACKQFGSIPQILREALKEELGIPMLLIEFDAGDARMTSLKSFKEKINMFTQTFA